MSYVFIDPEPSMEWRVHISCEGSRAQVSIASIRWESVDAWWLPRNDRNPIGPFTQRARTPGYRTKELSAPAKKVSWVCLVVFFCVSVFCFLSLRWGRSIFRIRKLARQWKTNRFVFKEWIFKRIFKWFFLFRFYYFFYNFIKTIAIEFWVVNVPILITLKKLWITVHGHECVEH